MRTERDPMRLHALRVVGASLALEKRLHASKCDGPPARRSACMQSRCMQGARIEVQRARIALSDAASR